MLIIIYFCQVATHRRALNVHYTLYTVHHFILPSSSKGVNAVFYFILDFLEAEKQKHYGCVQSLHFSDFLLEGDSVDFMSNFRRCHISHNQMRFRLSSSIKDKKPFKTEFNK